MITKLLLNKIIFTQFKNKYQIIYSLKCTILALFFCILWIYAHLPMGFWGVYSSFIVLNMHTAGTIKKGFQRVAGHVFVAFFSVICILFYTHNFIIISAICMMICFFILGYFISCGDNLRYIGVSGGIGLGIMFFEHPFQNATLETTFYRATIIICSGIFGILFDNFVFPTKTTDLLEKEINEIFTNFSLIQQSILSQQYIIAQNALLSLDEHLKSSLKYSNDLQFQPHTQKSFVSRLKKIFNIQKELIYNYKELVKSYVQFGFLKIDDNIYQLEIDLLNLLNSKLQLFNEKNFNIESLKNFKNENIILIKIREYSENQEINMESRTILFSRFSKIFQMLKLISNFEN